jgi:hypothetical protein
MTDRLESWLGQLPGEAMDEGLPARIRLRLDSVRSRERRLRRGLDGALLALCVIGFVLLVPPLLGTITELGGASVESSVAWVNELGTAPAPAVWSTLSGAAGWSYDIAGRLGVSGLAGLVLIALPMFAWLHRAMGVGRPASSAGARPNLRSLEGATA